MDETNQSNSSVFQTLAGVLAGGLQGYIDAQNQQPVYVVAPTPQTAYGVAGQPSYYAQGGASGTFQLSPILLIGLGLVAYVLLKK